MTEATRTNVDVAQDEQICPKCHCLAPTVDTEEGTPVTQGFTVESRCRDCGSLILVRTHWPHNGRMAQWITRVNKKGRQTGTAFEGWLSLPKSN